ncbi:MULTISPECIES: 50S ribosomal protein L33 [Ureaplasma]|uniref:Large ribosomal subunit protein bL33 n=2 Tax=Ureaplasma TaxID=2129 RepID=A0ABT3BP68_9BACT|nr:MULTISPECIES: 50S ribosomal protein L33 [Ureaplasma]MCV3728285.1 50S ribosomal protein L33 [Ureaplasma miroungigenitalium]MCV3734090.1 50S ribosomal protein L33 [Ureaplasma miroungigenitalium]MCV3743353.1 50S ribosomal protein L33 [Ureaplasma sp. ES3154-GEN]MCV3754021.1 50S ribosomal protein L33 [Ureaplasma zalophigenitalium]
MAVKRGVRFQCTECKNINYISTKNVKTTPEKLTLNKYCNNCRVAVAHTEIKKK